MNIFGGPFEPWVTNQIKARQKALGKGAKISSQELQYYHSKTPWIRLASAVDLRFDPKEEKDVPHRLKAIGFPTDTMDGYDLARNSVLFGGVTSLGGNDAGATGFSLNKGIKQQEGVQGPNGMLNLQGAYGWGGSTNRGLVPMPGIVDAQVEYYNNGALAKAIINIKCFSPEQFAIIDTLYQHPGFNLLLEFGWSMYLDNDGNLQNFDSFYTEPFEFLFNPKGEADHTHFTMYDKIVKERKARYGNYNGVFGKISKYNWSFNPTDGSYSIRVDIQGYGDMMESLKVNIPLVVSDDTPSPTDTMKALYNSEHPYNQMMNSLGIFGTYNEDYSGVSEETPAPPLIANAHKTALNFFLFEEYMKSWSNGKNNDFRPLVLENFQNPVNGFINEKLEIPNAFVTFTNTKTDTAIAMAQSPQVYMCFGALLALIQNKLLLYDEQGEKKTPLFRFDFDFFNLKEDDNYFSYMPGMFSGNPLSVLIPYENPPDIFGEDNFSIPSYDLNMEMQTISSFFKKEQYIARLGWVYMNINTVATILENAGTDEDGAISLLTLVNGLLGEIARCLGNFPLFMVRYDEDTNTIRIYDESPQRFDTIPGDGEYALINTYGVKPDTEGSFVKNISLNSELDNTYATMITVGAQFGGTSIGVDSTGFSSYNRGLVDRVIPTKVDYYTGKTEPETKLKEMFQQNIEAPSYSWGGQYLITMYGTRRTFNQEDISALMGHTTTYTQMLSEALVKNKQLQSGAFLPFNLKLELEGLSGMQLFQKFIIDDSVLPPSYERNSIDINIKSLSHNITTTEWRTTIDTIASPRSPMDPIKAPAPLRSSTTSQSGTGGGVKNGESAGGNLPAPPPAKPPADEKVRIRVRRLCDNGTETLGVMTVLDANGSELYDLAVVELPWKGNQNGVSCVPPNDTYRVKSHKSPKHGACFWLIGNGKGGYKYNALYGNGYVRSAVLIHRSPIAPGWLQGCLGPGLKFNLKQKNGKNPKGTGDSYLNPSKAQSQEAVDKLIGTLYNEGSFLMEIKNLNDVGEGQLPKDFSDPAVQNFLNAKPSRKLLIS